MLLGRRDAHQAGRNAPRGQPAHRAERGALHVTAQTEHATRPVALFVVGAQRSGTSALTRVLSLSGATLPDTLLQADKANPRGYWEPRPALDLNEAILHQHRSHWADPSLRLQEPGTIDAEETAARIAEIGAFLATLPKVPVVVIKEPRITLLCGLWFEAARQAGFDVATIVTVRHPQEVIASLGVHGGTSPELSSALWLKYSLLADKHTRGLPRVFVEYANLLEDWQRELSRISETLALELNQQADGSIEEFLAQSLRRQRHQGPVKDLFGTNWMSSVYEALSAAARDERLDEATLDHALEAYRAGERDFRTISEDYRNFHHEITRPSLPKLVGKFFTTAHRRNKSRPSIVATPSVAEPVPHIATQGD